jgi:uncharacterized protein
MPSPSVVLDTNIVVSAHLSALELPFRIYSLALNRQLRLFVSSPILLEYESVLCRTRFRFPAEKVAQSLDHIRQSSTLIVPTTRLSVSPDESDNRFLECADAAGADFLATGNQRHFPAVRRSTRIVSARELVESVFNA